MPYKDGGMAIKADRMRKRRLVDRKRLGRVSVLHSEQVRSGGEGTILELMGGYERKKVDKSTRETENMIFGACPPACPSITGKEERERV